MSVQLCMTQCCRRIVVTSDEALKLTWRTMGALKRVDERFAFLVALPSFLVAKTIHFHRCFEYVDLETHPQPPTFFA
jgi:hypothetical protein